MNGSTKRDHERAPLSNGTPGERDNLLRYRPGLGVGFVESHFLKANSPDGLRALWIKHTVLARPGAAERDVAELWAVAFERARRGGPVTKRAMKRTYPASSARFTEAPFSFAVGGAELGHGHARAELADAAWDLRYPCPEEAFRPFPYPGMYTGRFPRSKSLTPVPASTLSGRFRLAELDWDVSGFTLSQGHNWGASHAAAYAWTHVPAFDGHERVWLEALSGKVRIGGVTLPWLSVAALSIDGELQRFDGPRAMTSRALRVDTRSYALSLKKPGAALTLRIHAEDDAFAGLRYEDPDGSALACLNSKLAYAEVSLTAQGHTRTFKSERAALELGTRSEGHGITMLV